MRFPPSPPIIERGRVAVKLRSLIRSWTKVHIGPNPIPATNIRMVITVKEPVCCKRSDGSLSIRWTKKHKKAIYRSFKAIAGIGLVQ